MTTYFKLLGLHYLGPTGVPNFSDPNYLSKLQFARMGDVAIDEVYEKCLYITPVPGGVGPVTVATLLENTLKAYKIQKNI